MANVLSLNETIQNIVSEVEGMDKVEQKSLLAYIRALRISKKGKNPVPVGNPDLKPLTMEEIDHIKHKSRKSED